MPIDPETTKKVLTAITKAIAFFGKALDKIQKLRRNTITYRDLIHEMTVSKPNDPDVNQCAVLKENLPDGVIRLTIIYLDSENNPVFTSKDGKQSYGCEITVKQIDQELTAAFNGKSLLIFR